MLDHYEWNDASPEEVDERHRFVHGEKVILSHGVNCVVLLSQTCFAVVACTHASRPSYDAKPQGALLVTFVRHAEFVCQQEEQEKSEDGAEEQNEKGEGEGRAEGKKGQG